MNKDKPTEGDKIDGNLREIRYVVESLGKGSNVQSHIN
jgi:hypothetical protein